MTEACDNTELIEFLCNRRFHQVYKLPPNPNKKRTKPFQITYADYGNRESEAVVLLCGGMMGARFCHSPLDQLAKEHKVRIIHPDRPGAGGTDPVDLEERITMWLEMIPQLLAHLQIPYVSIASHSGGVIYALNTILMYPHLLHPQRPYVCFFAPWVHHSHSKVNILRATKLLPATAIGKSALVSRFLYNSIITLVETSSSFLQGVYKILHKSTPVPPPVPGMASTEQSKGPETSEELSNVALDDPNVVWELRKLIVTYYSEEQIDGGSADALLVLKRPRTLSWCHPDKHWSDIDDFVPILRKAIREEGAYGMGSRAWVFDTFHAEGDHMIGKKGKEWFDNCWMPAESSSTAAEPQIAKTYEYRSEVVEDCDHDFLMDPGFGASDKWLERVKEAFSMPREIGRYDAILHAQQSDRSLDPLAERFTAEGHLHFDGYAQRPWTKTRAEFFDDLLAKTARLKNGSRKGSTDISSHRGFSSTKATLGISTTSHHNLTPIVEPTEDM